MVKPAGGPGHEQEWGGGVGGRRGRAEEGVGADCEGMRASGLNTQLDSGVLTKSQDNGRPGVDILGKASAGGWLVDLSLGESNREAGRRLPWATVSLSHILHPICWRILSSTFKTPNLIPSVPVCHSHYLPDHYHLS